MDSVSQMFGSMVFNETVMQERLPKDIFISLKKTIDEGKSLDLTVANSVANAMKNWAIEKGATHYTHWFQPLTGFTAEKHDGFITPTSNGKVIMEFSGKELIKGEGDGSSFPSGGLRATCEGRGYTTWDPTSYAFIKDGSLCIPTAFCSFSGDALDKKTPLLRSMEALDKQSKRVLKLFGKNVKHVSSTVGAEQEYFLIDKKLYEQRKDLMFCNRTLFGAKPPKCQELEDHYFGAIKPRIAAFMKELDEELWKLGIVSKTKHNEVAPAQHEMAPVFTTTNIATDQNQLTMEIMKKVALRHDLVCLLHEKPFAYVNGSGKHNNWSLSTNNGENLFEPGNTPEDNAQFLLFLTSVIKAVDDYQDLLRVSVASCGNDHRLGADEAPPAIISIFLGDELTAILESIISGKPYDKKAKEVLTLGVQVLPAFPKDNTDRNRTSPFAFTGNKFEFRSLGSSTSIACPNIMLNTILAESLCQAADELEKAQDFTKALNTYIKDTLSQHKRIIFNGDGYSQEWPIEAQKRGLLNLRTTSDAMQTFLAKKNVSLFTKHKVHSKSEMIARHDIQLEDYCKSLNIEARTMINIAQKEILPAIFNYVKDTSDSAISVQNALKCQNICAAQLKVITELTQTADTMSQKIIELEDFANKAQKILDITKKAVYYTNFVIPAMTELRATADNAETIVAKSYWPFPTYEDLLFKI